MYLCALQAIASIARKLAITIMVARKALWLIEKTIGRKSVAAKPHFAILPQSP
jgi:hypothetical protein